jgi:hypothetical protein
MSEKSESWPRQLVRPWPYEQGKELSTCEAFPTDTPTTTVIVTALIAMAAVAAMASSK